LLYITPPGRRYTISYEIPAVRRAVRLLKHLAEADHPLGVSELARRLGTNKNMVFRLLQTLKGEDWVVRETSGKYRLSLQPFHYASKVVNRMDLRRAGAAPLRALWEATGANCYLGVLDGDRVLYVEHLDAVGDIKVAAQVGGRYLLHCSAPGKVLLAHAPSEVFDRVVEAGLERHTDRTLCDPTALRDDLAEVRCRGWATDLEEYARGLMCVAAPAYNHADAVVGAVGLAVLTLHYTPERLVTELVPPVLRAAGEVSLAMGMNEAHADRFRLGNEAPTGARREARPARTRTRSRAAHHE
jgi:IclR family acetate operon transcriptional repressor